jgi:anti-sigma factor RsiW
MSVNENGVDRGWRLPWRCRRWREPISLLALGVLEVGESVEVEAHLVGCPECRARLETLRAVQAGVRQQVLGTDVGVCPGPSPDLRARWEMAVRDSTAPMAEAHGGGARRAGFQASEPPETWGRAGGWDVRWIWGAVAACWVLVGALRLLAPAVDRAGAPVPRVVVSVRDIRLALGQDGQGGVPGPSDGVGRKLDPAGSAGPRRGSASPPGPRSESTLGPRRDV